MRGSSIHAAILPLILGVGLAACNREAPVRNEAVDETAGNETGAVPPVRIPEPQPPLNRAQLLAAANRAASLYAAGRPPPAEEADLNGREFAITIPFGCPGAVQGEREAGMSWSYDAEEERLRLGAEPNIDTEAPVVRAIGGDHEAVEGFWIPRAWTDSEDCLVLPGATATSGTPVQPTPPNVGLAQFFTAADSRTRQRAGRAYETVERLEPQQLPNEQGFRLVLAGRIAPPSSGGTIACHSPKPDVRPVCLIAVEIDRVSFENPRTGSTLASWEPR